MVNLCELQTNYLQNNGFQLILPRFPLVTYYAQNFQFPSINLPPATVANPFTKMPLAGDEIEFEPFSFQFIVDDRMQNYREIHDWITRVGFAESYEKFTSYENKNNNGSQLLGEQDAKVAILSAKSNPTAHITFYDAIPIALSGAEFTTQDAQTNYIMATATFAYTHFSFDPS
jgi:hypothetical protein